MIGYVKETRQMIETNPLLICGASVIIFDELGKVLMLQRSDNDCWCFPKRTMELGEKLEQTARRAAFEETGLQVDALELFGVFSGDKLRNVSPPEDEVYHVDVVFTASHCKGTIAIHDERKAYRFFNIDELPSNINPPTKPVVSELLNRLPGMKSIDVD